ncbi:hypothetical protein JD292_11615 [Leucobacter sp. CSA2]|uniref:Uncharacterized protein n=1 Tax=Leucobacter edaphi TaxID=2796472 RepID=A0A934UXF9_9MICO|nr:hypothetical protein [Leucobacter edaphi]MBK0422719.1 hypothetical protein [Leucobacter edaphi]
MSETVHSNLRSWATGSHATEAAVELLIRADLASGGSQWVRDASLESSEPPRLYVDHAILVSASDSLSGQSRAIARLAASMLGGDTVDLSTALPALDRDHVMLVLAAVAHAAGSHEDSAPRMAGGKVVGTLALGPAFAWPQLTR